MKYVVCYSGGKASALTAIEAVRKYGKQNVILLNHDISSEVEHADIKRFKRDVADYLDLDITQANMENFEEMSPIKLCRKQGGFQFQAGNAICTYQLKTTPFYEWLEEEYPEPIDLMAGTLFAMAHPCEMEEATVLYGFDINEKHRIQRRSQILGTKGYKTDYPLALWNRTIENTEEIGIKPPITYKIFKHANCIGCLKAGRQHWYIVYCLYPEIFKQGLEAENEIGHSIIKGVYLEEMIPKYKAMQNMGICPNDKEQSQTFWAKVNNYCPEQQSLLPCDCAVL